MSKVEEVAKAIAVAFMPEAVKHGALSPKANELFRKSAEAAIEAMMEPPPASLGALCAWAELSGNKVSLEKDARLVWQDVIQAALDEGVTNASQVLHK